MTEIAKKCQEETFNSNGKYRSDEKYETNVSTFCPVRIHGSGQNAQLRWKGYDVKWRMYSDALLRKNTIDWKGYNVKGRMYS